MSTPDRKSPPFDFASKLAMTLAAILYSAFVIALWGEAHLDVGDGNYMYIASRIAEGAVVYRDVLAPQPPCHLFLGAAIVKISQLAGMESSLYLFRAFSLLLHLVTAALTAGLARRAWGDSRVGAVAFVIYLILPLGLWWSMGYQSEPLEIFFLLLMMRSALDETRGGDLRAGVWGALAALTNATAAPILLVLIIYMFIRDSKRAIRIAVPALILAGIVTAALEFYTGGYFIHNAVLNQAGTYPREGLIRYAIGKLIREGSDIIGLEGAFIILAIIGLFRFLKTSPLFAQGREGMAWFSLATFGSIFYVTKGGTMDYIFTLAEPALAIMSAGAMAGLAREFRAPRSDSATSPASPILLACIFSVALFFAMGLPLAHYTRLWNGVAWELPEYDPEALDQEGKPLPNIQQVKEWIERNSKPGDTILAPPFYAFLTGRRVWGDYSEIFIWTMKDRNDREANNPEGEGWRKTRALADAIKKKELPILLVDMNQTGRSPEIMAALEASYHPLIEKPYQTLNTPLGVYVPKP